MRSLSSARERSDRLVSLCVRPLFSPRGRHVISSHAPRRVATRHHKVRILMSCVVMHQTEPTRLLKGHVGNHETTGRGQIPALTTTYWSEPKDKEQSMKCRVVSRSRCTKPLAAEPITSLRYSRSKTASGCWEDSRCSAFRSGHSFSPCYTILVS